MKIRTVIIEDEKHNVDILSHFLGKYCPEVIVIGNAGEVKEGVALIESTTPDLIFLDVMLEEGTGFDLLNNITHLQPKIIFITAYNDYAIKAFKYCALDYLLKPLQIEELKSAVGRVNDELQNKNYNAQLNLLVQQLSPPKETEDEFIAIPMANKIELVRIKDILYIAADGKYSKFELHEAKSILSSKNIGEYEKLLADKDHFLRVHNTFIINLRYVKSINKVDGISCIMSTDEYIPVSRRKKDELFQKLKI